MKECFLLMSKYNQWQNEKMYSLCSKIPEGDRKKDLGAFFKSIHGTLNHILLGDRAWLGRFTGKPFAVSYLNQELYADFDELWKERKKTDSAIDDWIRSLNEEILRSDFTYTSGVDKVTRTLPLWSCVLHLFNHQTHHRGQASTLMKQMGVDPGIMDLPWTPGLAKEEKV